VTIDLGGGPTAPDPKLGPAGLLLSRDLIFTSKITGTARALGSQVLTAGSPALALEMIERWRPRLVLVDLAAGELVAPGSILAYRRAAGPETTFLVFGSHVDTEALAGAAAAGCDPVLPRSKFSAELPALLRRYLLTD
jgi:DNA-binding NarL/FixJ family response regulator